MPNVHISANPASALAGSFASLAGQLPACNVAVSGGSTPRELFQILANDYRTQIAWERVSIFQVDERCVPPTDSQSNWKMLHEELLAKVTGITAHRIEAERANAAEDYEALIRNQVEPGPASIPCFDLVLLGMGADGHTASLFPATNALDEGTRLVVLNHVPQMNSQRVTMTFPLINTAKNRWFLARGGDKAEAFRLAQLGKVPSGRINNPVWFVDLPVTKS